MYGLSQHLRVLLEQPGLQAAPVALSNRGAMSAVQALGWLGH